jgi:hypothetical protein
MAKAQYKLKLKESLRRLPMAVIFRRPDGTYRMGS